MGTATGVFSGRSNHRLRLETQLASQSIEGNYSTINWQLYLDRTSGTGSYYLTAGGSRTVSIGGNVWNGGAFSYDTRSVTTIAIGSGAFNVGHDPDGTGSYGFSSTVNAPGTIGNASCSDSESLPTIPRATQPTVSPTSGNTGSTYTIGHTPASSAFYHDVAYSLDGGASYTNIATDVVGTTTSTSWTPAHSLLPNTTSATAIIRVTTRSSSGGSIIGSKTVNLPLTVPASVKPTISSVLFADSQTSSPDIPTLMGGIGRFVQGWSKLLPTVTSAGAGGSTVVSSKVTQAGQVTESGVAFGLPVLLSGAVPFSAIVTDSRGVVSDPYANTVAVKAYNFPNLPTPLVTRTSDAAGAVPSPTGTYLAITPGASVSSLVFGGTEKNLLEWRVRIKPTGGSFTTVQDWTNATVSGNTWTTKYVAAGPYASDTEWVVEVSIRDLFGKNGFNPGSTITTLTVLVPSEQVFMDWDGNDGIGLGGYRRDPFMLDVHGAIGQDGKAVLDEDDQTTINAAILSARDSAFTVARNRNRVINGNFRTNQNGFTSGSKVLPGAFGFDRWTSLNVVNGVQNPTAGAGVKFWSTGPSAAGGIGSVAGTIPGVSHQGKVFRSTMASGEAYGLYLNGNATSGAGITLANLPRVKPGKQYTFSIYVNPSVAKTMRISPRTYDGAGNILSTYVGTMTALTAGVWTRLSVTFTADATASAIVVFSEVATNWALNDTLDFGAAMLNLGSTPATYFDGATAGGGGWAGTANASISYRDPVPTLTFTAAPQGQPVTISAGASIAQVIERANIEAGTRVMSWEGDATGRVYNVGATPPAYAVSGLTATLDGLADVVVEMLSGTVGKVQLELGTVATPFERMSRKHELDLGGGVQGVIPSSIVISSGTASASPEGLITFSGCSTLSLNDVFDGLGLDTYKVFVQMLGTVGAGVYTRFRIDGVDVSLNNYNYVGTISSNATGPNRSSQFGVTFAGYWNPGVSYPPDITAEATIFTPRSRASQSMRLQSNIAASDRYMWDEYMQLSGTVVDGISIICSGGGTISGKIKVVKVS